MKANTAAAVATKELEKELSRNDSDQASFAQLLQRAETLEAEKMPEKKEHTKEMNKRMSEFTRRNSQKEGL